MIPLMRPLIPELSELAPYYEISRKANQWSNCGPVWEHAVHKLNRVVGRYCLPVANGSVAIEIALRNNVRGSGKRVLIPDFTHVGTLQAVARAGLLPVMGPVSKKTWTLDLEHMAKHLEHFDSFIVVAPFGYRVNFAAYDDFSERYGKPVIYDLAGSWGTPLFETEAVATFSLHATKNFSCGEGGIVCFNSEEQFDRARRYTNFNTLPDRHILNPSGYNLKIDELKAAMICAHLDRPARLRERYEAKRTLIDFYQDELEAIVVRHDLHLHPHAAPSLCVLAGLPAVKLETQSKDITFRQYYIRLSSMPGLDRVARIGQSSEFFSTCVALPSDPAENEIDHILDVVRKLK
jgi:dTDP-4-amino-4,6-dideoxygalactose transaminase